MAVADKPVPCCCLLWACSEKSIKSFAEGVVSGSLTPEYKSAPEPEEPTDGGVSVVVGKNFEKIVQDEGKDVLLEVRGFLHGTRARGRRA